MKKCFIPILFIFFSCNLFDPEVKAIEFSVLSWNVIDEVNNYGPGRVYELRIIGTFNNWGGDSSDLTEIWNNALETSYYDGEIKAFKGNIDLTVGDIHQYTLLVKYKYLADYTESIEYIDTKWLSEEKDITATPSDQFVDNGKGVDYYNSEFVVK